MNVRRCWIGNCLIGIALVAAHGCGGPAYEYDSTVTGTVTIDGELANGGTVTFHPVEKGRLAIGRIHSDGSYSLRTGQGDLSKVDGGTVMPGDYLVTVSISAAPSTENEAVVEGEPPIAGPSLIASKYRQKNTTDLRFTIKPGPQVIVLNLDRAEQETPADESGAVDSAEGGEDEAPPAESPVGENIDSTGAPAPEVNPPADDVVEPGDQAQNVEKLAP
jgi:hypothetical protein